VSSFYINSSSKTIAMIDDLQVRGEGLAWPRLIFWGTMRTPGSYMAVRFLTLFGLVKFGGEVVGRAELEDVGQLWGELPSGFRMTMPVSPAAIVAVEHAATGHELDFLLDFEGLALVKNDMPIQQRKFLDEFPPGEWVHAGVRPGTGSVATLKIARSSWVKEVLEKLGIGQYILMELRLPPAPYGESMAKALVMLKEAEAQFHLGHDPAVFLHCRGAFEVLSGAPKGILAKVSDSAKAAKVDDLLKGIVAYLHYGRHPSKAGTEAGTFAVDHKDAEYALSVSKMTLAYIARLLSAS
jgi:hypothetical protein